jgi:hypothetical protein
MNHRLFVIAATLMTLFFCTFITSGAEARGSGRHYSNQGGHYQGGHGSSHKGGHYKNSRTGDHYTRH